MGLEKQGPLGRAAQKAKGDVMSTTIPETNENVNKNVTNARVAPVANQQQLPVNSGTAQEKPNTDSGSSPPLKVNGKPRLNMSKPIHTLLKDAEAVLENLGFYYQRSGEIVYPFVLQEDSHEGVGISRKKFSIIIKPETEFSILRRLAAHSHCFKRDAKGIEYWSDPPAKLAQHLHDHAAQSPDEC